MPPWAVALGIAGLLAGPSGIVWAVLNRGTDQKGKEISQTGELVAMFRAYIDEMEASLDRAQADLDRERTRGNGEASRADTATEALVGCQIECRRLRLELDRVLAEARAGLPPGWTPPPRD